MKKVVFLVFSLNAFCTIANSQNIFSSLDAAKHGCFGGDGGVPFTDYTLTSGTRISVINVWSGTMIDAIRIDRIDKSGKTIIGLKHGGNGGRLSSITLAYGEFINKISLRAGKAIDLLALYTNMGRKIDVGGGGGKRFDINFNEGFDGITGRSSNLLDAICFVNEPISASSTPVYIGGTGGNPFNDINMNAHISAVHIWSGSWIDAIQVDRMDQNGKTIIGQKHGGNGGTLTTINLALGEFINKITGRNGTLIDHLTFYTNYGRVFSFGGNGGNPFNDIHLNEGLKNISGRASSALDGIKFQ